MVRLLAALVLVAAACRPASVCPSAAPPSGPATAEEADAFVKSAEADLLAAWVARDRISWVNKTFITHDTDTLAAAAEEKVMELSSRKSGEAVRYDRVL